MEESAETVENLHCLGCLCSSNENKLQDYYFKNSHLLAIFEVGTVKLCFSCRRMAHHTEIFMNNVHSNQALLKNCLGDFSAIQEARLKLQPLTTLTQKALDNFDFESSTDHKPNLNDELFLNHETNVKQSNSNKKGSINSEETKIKIPIENVFINDSNIKLELKDEEDQLEIEIVGLKNECSDSFLKEEDSIPLKVLLKQEVQIESSVGTRVKKKTVRKKIVKKNVRAKKIKKEIDEPKVARCKEVPGIKKIFITEEQYKEERKQLALDKNYINCTYKCEDCLKGFNFKAGYEQHLEKHSEKMGEFECELCTIRMETEDKILTHKRSHKIRYKCTECGIVRISRKTIKDHYAAYHREGEKQYICPYCSKGFKRQESQRKHMNIHMKKERVTCLYCPKSYANKEGLKYHAMLNHPKEVSASEVLRQYPCEECGKSFKSLSELKNHGTKHSVQRDYYCVECDKAFKSAAVLRQHLKTAQPHVNYLELPLSCPHCVKKFSTKRDLERHSSVHLEVKPTYQCDKCDKVYVSNCTLNDHKRHVHDGIRRPRRFACHLCEKLFDRTSILKKHIRTHTGERPYECPKCAAQFAQSGALATHDRLVHLRLTKDGRPKPSALK